MGETKATITESHGSALRFSEYMLYLFLEFITVGVGVISQSSACFWEPFLPTGLRGPVLS